jgi:hypothetical protein
VFCTIHPQFGTHIPVHNYEMYIIYIFRFTNQCNIWGLSGSISVYCMLYALMLHSGASVASFMLCLTGNCISHLITIAAYSFIITYLLMLYTCIHTHARTHTHTVLVNNPGSLIFYISYMFMLIQHQFN